MTTAEVYVRVLPRLAGLDVTSLGVAQAFAQPALVAAPSQTEAAGVLPT